MAITVTPAAVQPYQDYTPTISQNGARTTSSLVARYVQIGKMVHAYGSAVVSNAGTTNNAITVSLPVAVNTSISTANCGVGEVHDIGTALYRSLGANFVSGGGNNYIRFFRDNTATSGGPALGESGGPAFALASGDIITWNVTYEAA